MRKMLLLCLLLIGGIAIGQTFQIGDWTVSRGEAIEISYKEKKLVTDIAIGTWTQGYAKGTYDFKEATATGDEKTVVMTKATDAANAKLTFTAKGKTLDVDLNIDIKTSGPFEYGFYMPLDSFRNADNSIYCKLGKNYFLIGKDAPFRPRGDKSLTFELPDANYTFTTVQGGAFVLQDCRRGHDGDVRFITNFHVDKETTVEYKHTWTIEDDFDEETKYMREQIFKTPLLKHTEVTFPNPGFEDGLESWDKFANVGIDSTVAHTGKNSAKIVVKDPKTENVYITRQIPIVPGAQYIAEVFVKTKDVAAASGRMPSVGAGLIVEWADKSGKWLAAGSYACDQYGTKDWLKVACTMLRAPEDAGYANIYLALRGTGTAWFDDLTLTLVEQSIDKLYPRLNATLSTNTPLFSWVRMHGVSTYYILLSQDPEFAPDKVRRYSVNSEVTFQLREALEQGTWYWKVESPGSPDKQPWVFKTTVPKDKDCLPPTILSRAQRVTDGKESFRVMVEDNGAKPPHVFLYDDELKVIYIGKHEKTEGLVHTYVLSDKDGWPKGFKTLRLVARDDFDNESERAFWLLNAPKPKNPAIINKDGWFEENGKRIFPLGIYEVTKDDMLEVRRAGYDVVHTYRWESSQDDVACREYLDDCWAAEGLRAFVGFDRGTRTSNGIVQGNFEHVAKRVGALADHPGLFCWYLFDEPEISIQYVSPKQLTEFADLVRELDPYHAVVMTTWGKTMINYRRTWDTHWSQAYGQPSGVVALLDEHRRFLNNDSPITLLVNCNDKNLGEILKKGGKVDPAEFSRDYDSLRACAFLGITEQTNGIFWWWFARNSRHFYSASMHPTSWGNLVKVVQEIKSLAPVVNADVPANNGTVKNGEATVKWWTKKVDGKTTAIVVNTSTEPQSVSIDLPDYGKTELQLRRYEVKVMTK